MPHQAHNHLYSLRMKVMIQRGMGLVSTGQTGKALDIPQHHLTVARLSR